MVEGAEGLAVDEGHGDGGVGREGEHGEVGEFGVAGGDGGFVGEVFRLVWEEVRCGGFSILVRFLLRCLQIMSTSVSPGCLGERTECIRRISPEMLSSYCGALGICSSNCASEGPDSGMRNCPCSLNMLVKDDSWKVGIGKLAAVRSRHGGGGVMALCHDTRKVSQMQSTMGPSR